MADGLFDDDTRSILVDQFRSKRLQCDGDGPSPFVVINLEQLEIGVPVEPKTNVFRAVWNKDRVAVKFVGKLNKREVEVLNGINHKNIVRFFGAVFDPPTNYGLVTELYEKGSLFDYIHTESNPLDLAMALQLAKGIASGVRYLHKDAPDAPIKHNNLTSHEVVLKEMKGVLVPKITGFGYARQHSETQITTSRGQVHIHALMSPERIRGERSSPESDIYSVGIIMSELVSRKVPFEGIALLKACSLVTDDKKRPEIPCCCSKKLADLINSCWEQEVEDRLTAGEVDALLERMTKKPSIKKPAETQDKLKAYAVEPDLLSKSVPHRSPSPSVSIQSMPSHPDWQIDAVEISEVSEPFPDTGRIGVVRKAKYQKRPVVVKGLRQFVMDGFDKYVDVVFPIEHENIVKVMGATNSYIVMEEMPMSLACRLERGPITENNDLLKIAIGVASGLHHLHRLTNSFVHGNIHPRNVFVDSENNAKISDFGYINLDRDVGLAPTPGMEAYHAPEGKQITRYSVGVDIYSFGVLLIEMYTLERDLDKLKSSWPNLHTLAVKCTKKRQEGMYERGRMSMRCIIKELNMLRK